MRRRAVVVDAVTIGRVHRSTLVEVKVGRSSFQRANRRIAVMAVVVAIAGSAIGGQETEQFRERVRVDRVSLDARALDDRATRCWV